MTLAERLAQQKTPECDALMAEYPMLFLRPMETREQRILDKASSLERRLALAVELLEKSRETISKFPRSMGYQFTDLEKIDAALLLLKATP